MKLIVNAPINSLSFGNVTYNILRELYKKNIDICLFPIGNQIDLSAFDKITPSFQEYIERSINERYQKIAKDTPCLKLWHINGSESKYSTRQSLFTFHETSKITPEEKNLLALQDNIFVTSNYSKNIFEIENIENVSFSPLGFDEDFFVSEKEYLANKKHFGLLGKFEERKNTARIINTWCKLFGNNPEFQLTCVIQNPFLNESEFQNSIMQATNGVKYNNINFLPRLRTNSEINDFMNSIDIDLSGLSGGEGWNLPSFNCTALGKWSIVLKCTGHLGWATKENSILIEPSKLKDCYDNRFFRKGDQFNQGQFYDLEDSELESAILDSVGYINKENTEGLKLQNQFKYSDTVETILNKMNTL